MTEAARFVTSFDRSNLTYRVKSKRNSFEGLADLVGRHKSGSIIIYCSSRKKTEEIASRLSNIGFGALPYHAGLEADTRRQTQERFLGGQVSIIVATIAFGMGIDNPCVRLVVHYDLPRSIEGYYQETGRAGRDGQPSDCVLFFSYADRSQQDFFIRKIEDDVERANAEKRLELMVDYCQAKSCRRQFLLNYFGEDWPHNNCGGCDICLPASDHLDLRVEFDGDRDNTEAIVNHYQDREWIRGQSHCQCSPRQPVKTFVVIRTRSAFGLWHSQRGHSRPA